MKKIKLIAPIAALLLGISGPASGKLVFNLDFGQDGNYETSWNLALNDTIRADLYVSNVPNPGLISMGFDLVYNLSHLQVASASVASIWELGWVNSTAPEVEAGGGQVSFPPLAGDRILLASVEFTSSAYGMSTLSLYDSDRGGFFDDFVLENGTVLDDDLASGIVLAQVNTPNLIPLPGTLALLAPGLVALLASRSRMKLIDEEKRS
ncbi:MAG: hypothetical protein ABTS16_02890 [Candidatus Accumulibacter phosphatis]|jgi:hypothetical protein|uniref:Cohesin domain-containing protein n=1 Tax=Candidatus Accumulibacter contiguus TaxID=2954381 RepID=A0ABX1T8I8_9PROT|nr:hypothetical protein [Candidatus Accumulibacter contiguus]NMQ05398.1 hypothetical protein [Candidatus Accumulibacter contiguus]